MKTRFKLIFLALAALAAPIASAQLVLQSFDSFESPNTFFVGSWDGGGNAPLPTFSQGAGNYRFEGGLNDDASGVYYFFNAPLDLTGYAVLEVSAQRLTDNAAATFSVKLFSGSESAFAVFSTAEFPTSGFTNILAPLTFTPGFDLAAVDSFLITGDQVGGMEPLNFAVDRLAVSVPVPEPSTYGLLGAALIAAAVAGRRLRRTSRS